MGSTSTGRLGDYPGTGRTRVERPGSGGGSTSGDTPDDRCARPFVGPLEEVERCPYFDRVGGPPPLGTDVEVLGDLVGGRVAVGTVADNEVIGYLPTQRNYIRACIQAGWRYIGQVSEARTQPTVLVFVELQATR